MKKHICIILFSFIICNLIVAHSFTAGVGVPYYSDDSKIQDFYLNGKMDLNENTFLSLNFNELIINNFNFSNYFNLDQINLNCVFIDFWREFKKPFFNSLGLNLIFSNSSAGDCNVSFLGLEENCLLEFSNTVGGGFSLDFSKGFQLNTELIHCSPSLMLLYDQNKVFGDGYFSFFSLSKNLYLMKSLLDLCTGILNFSGCFDCDFFTDISFFKQQFIFDGDVDLFTCFGLIKYSFDKDLFSFNFLTGIFYISAMDITYDGIMRTQVAQTWYRKKMNGENNSLQDYGLLPLAFDMSFKLHMNVCTVVPSFEKVFLVPIDFSNKSNNVFDLKNDKEMVKQILLSGLSLKFSILFSRS